MKRPPAGFIPKSRAGRDDVQIGGRMRAVRIDRGITQAELGDALGVSFQQIQKYEKGVNKLSATRLHQVALFLKTTDQELTGFAGTAHGGFTFDNSSYRLASILNRLPNALRLAHIVLINAYLKDPELDKVTAKLTK